MIGGQLIRKSMINLNCMHIYIKLCACFNLNIVKFRCLFIILLVATYNASSWDSKILSICHFSIAQFIMLGISLKFWLYMWLDLQKVSYTRNYKYLEIRFWNIQFIISQECTEQLVCISPLIYSHPSPFSGWTLQWIVSYSTAQFKFDIYMRVTHDFLDKFLMPLVSYTWENH